MSIFAELADNGPLGGSAVVANEHCNGSRYPCAHLPS